MVLFLDFDGVLHPDPSPAERLFEHAPALAAALAPHAVDIVLSTTWRRVEPLAALKARLPATLADRIVGVTPSFSEISAAAGPLYPYPRQAECIAWLRQNAPLRAWHALDDRQEWFEPYCEHLTVCEPQVGLTAPALVHLSSALQRAAEKAARRG